MVKEKTLRAQETRLAWSLLALPLIIIFGVVLYPVAYNIWLSLHQVTLNNLNGPMPWSGLDNFFHIIKDRQFQPALVTTIIYSLGASFFSVFFGLAAALVLNRSFPGRGVVRGLFLFPFVAPVISVAFIWRWLLAPDGVLNWYLTSCGLITAPVAFLDERIYALISVIFFEGWRYFPFAMLLILARLQAIPQSFYEAADLDGAGSLAKFRYITLPELRYILGILFLLRVMWTFNKFDDIYLLTSGAAGTKVLSILIYEYSFGSADFGAGAAIAMVLFVILFTFVWLYIKKVIEW